MEPFDGLVRRLSLVFVDLAGEFIYGLNYHRLRGSTVKRRFVSAFGILPRHCALVWLYCKDDVFEFDHGRKKIHLLWTLNLLKSGETEHVLHGRWRADEKTIRKWTKLFLVVLSNLEVVSIVQKSC